MDYREYIYKLCKDTDFTKEEEAIKTAQFLASEAIRHFRVLELQDEYMKLHFAYKQVEDMAKAVAKKAFKEEIEGLPEGDFKDICMEHMEEITRD